jgi:hypothetical protein
VTRWVRRSRSRVLATRHGCAARPTSDSLFSCGGSSLGLVGLPSAAPLAGGGIAMEGSRTMPRDHRFGLDENECFGPAGPDLTNDTQNRRSNPFSLGRGCLRCKQQVAVEERPPPMPNGAARSETLAGIRASRISPSSSFDANRLHVIEAADHRGCWSFDDPQRF